LRAAGDAPIIAPGGLMVEQQGQPLGMAQAGGIAITVEVGKGMGHAGQAKLVQQIKRWMFEHHCTFQW
jgi:hypothetical protein